MKVVGSIPAAPTIKSHMVTAIAAMAQNRVIGKDGKIPWNLPVDLQNFKRETMGKTIIMGRLTYDSLGGALPHRTNIVLSKKLKLIGGATVYNDLKQALGDCKGDVFIIGGAQIYKEGFDLQVVDRILLTVLSQDYDGDTFFPIIPQYLKLASSSNFLNGTLQKDLVIQEYLKY